ncbi:hypothetical protein FSP39_017708 [Pinctada imbricata]|uniref:Neurotransmitter-gated ion-channel ligand-binding domain-containing protein n=1 Tax=Pinctada imbricata TaxID=66713 RepID=A0AA88YDQ5_PINIB|nr:hypothetical protein FSP39_017708 [Pinctada imbricata]
MSKIFPNCNVAYGVKLIKGQTKFVSGDRAGEKVSHGIRKYNRPEIHSFSFDDFVPFLNEPLGLHYIRTKLYSVPLRKLNEIYEYTKDLIYSDTRSPEYRLQGVILDISTFRLFQAVRSDKSEEKTNRPFIKKTNWLEVFGWETIQWTDPRLIWNPTEFNNLKVINLDPDKIWIPDIILWNGSTQNSGRIHSNMKARVTSHGHVHYAPMVRHVIRCVPKGEVFDCKMTYGSWAYDSTQLALNITRDYVDISTYNSNSDFTIVNTSAELHTSTSECCPGAFYDITYTITLKWKDSDSFDGLSPQDETGGYVSSTKYGTDKTSTGMNSTDTNNGTQSFDSPTGTNSTTSNNNTES